MSFLLKNKVAIDKKDDYGLTVADVARKFGHENLIELITNHEGSLV